MSPLWRDTVTIGVSPAGIAALRHRRGLRPALIAREHRPCAADPASVAGQLASLFSRPEWQGCDIRYVLSGHFVHYAVVPSDPKVRSRSERATYTQLVFEKIYGSLARNWDIRLSPATASEAALASGVDRALLTALRESAPSSVRIVAIRPHLMCAFNAIARRLDAAPAAIALTEAGRITLAFVKKGQWLGVSSRAFEDANGEALRQALSEQCMLLGVDADGPLWLNDLAGHCAPPAGSAWQVRPFGDTAVEPPYRLAALGMAS